MIIDGKQLALKVEERIKVALRNFSRTPSLVIITVGANPVTESFVRIKKRVGERLGIPIIEKSFRTDVSGEELIHAIKELAADELIDGIVVQLPLPPHVDTEAILSAIPITKDVDVLSRHAIAMFARGDSAIIPPVAGAIQAILEFGEVRVAGEEVLVLGHGRLVGAPAALLLRHNGAHMTVIDRAIPDLAAHMRESSIVVSGVGQQNLIVPSMLREGSVLIDAGTSELGGRVVGDADPRCAEVASLFTPVPGGVGPLAVAMLFKNLLVLARERRKTD